MANKIVLFGAPGAGKGTIAHALCSLMGYKHFSTGEMLRHEMAISSPLGIKIKTSMDSGDLISDDIMNELIAHHINNVDHYILDGYPRTVKQAVYLDSINKPDLIINLTVDNNVVIERLLNRGRPDDKEDVIKHRLDIFYAETCEIMPYWDGKYKMCSLNGNDDQSAVLDAAMPAILQKI